MEEIRTGEALYEGKEPCVVRLLSGPPASGTRHGYYVEWGRKIDGTQFGVRLGPFATMREAVSEVEAKTNGTIAWLEEPGVPQDHRQSE